VTIGEPPNDTGWEGGREGVLLLCSVLLLEWDKGGKGEDVSRLSMEHVSKPNGATKGGKEGGR
jgi:hypothetical protein